MEIYLEKGQFTETRNAHELIGLRVLSPSGHVVGKVTQVQLDHAHAFAGVVVKGRIPSGTCYLANSFIQRMTHDAVFLNIEPAFVFIGRKVMSSDGKSFGRVKEVHRAQHTNNIASFLVKRGMFRTQNIAFGRVKKMGDAIILKETYDEARKHAS